MSSETSKMDEIAAMLKSKADEVLNVTKSDEDAANTGGSQEGMRNIAKIVKENAEKGMTNSKEYLSSVFTQVSAYASGTSSTASSKYAEAKERGLSSADAAKEVASQQYENAKSATATHIAGVHANINRAIAQGQSQGSASGTTDRDLSSDPEELSFPYNVVAWCASLCGKSTSTMSATSKDFSVDSLQNAAAVLTDSLHEQVQAVQDDASKAKEEGGEMAEAAKSSVSTK